jgi:hypothetical protein
MAWKVAKNRGSRSRSCRKYCNRSGFGVRMVVSLSSQSNISRQDAAWMPVRVCLSVVNGSPVCSDVNLIVAGKNIPPNRNFSFHHNLATAVRNTAGGSSQRIQSSNKCIVHSSGRAWFSQDGPGVVMGTEKLERAYITKSAANVAHAVSNNHVPTICSVLIECSRSDHGVANRCPCSRHQQPSTYQQRLLLEQTNGHYATDIVYYVCVSQVRTPSTRRLTAVIVYPD